MDWEYYYKVIRSVADRYVLLAGVAFVICYLLLKKLIAHKKIQQRYPRLKDYAREIGFSFLTISIFALVPLFLIRNDHIRPYTTYYKDISTYGWTYFYLAFIIMLFAHDTYFYWVHRLMHHPRIFRYCHLIHHKSTNPSPWAAYAFHPIEAILEAGIVIIFLFTIPIHLFHLSFFFLFMIVYNVYGHLGWELYPKRFSRHWLGKWINTSVNHNQHHQYFKGNYGLYFLIWDRLMGTIRKDYEEQFEEVKSRRKPGQ